MRSAALLPFLALLASGEALAFPRTLFIGDSQSCETFGRALDDRLREAARDQVVMRARWGSAPHDWYEGQARARFRDRDPGMIAARQGPQALVPELRSLLDETRPGLVIVELGANLYWALDTNPDFIARTVDRMVADIRASGAGCVWVGPAHTRARPRIAEVQALLVRAIRGRCLYFDSIPITPYPSTGGDGLHFDSLGPDGSLIAENWAKKVFERVRNCVPQASRRLFRSPECAGLQTR
ncbi:MAG TPA: SGNH/GDSL hydrolase family protein [Bdellovibrionota bacterium]|nr:SGNH/GDSL hydrolase family protein [Bdellovibrionota bacterium]